MRSLRLCHPKKNEKAYMTSGCFLSAAAAATALGGSVICGKRYSAPSIGGHETPGSCAIAVASFCARRCSDESMPSRSATYLRREKVTIAPEWERMKERENERGYEKAKDAEASIKVMEPRELITNSCTQLRIRGIARLGRIAHESDHQLTLHVRAQRDRRRLVDLCGDLRVNVDHLEEAAATTALADKTEGRCASDEETRKDIEVSIKTL